MKRCPECRRDYYDDSLLYCLDDGSALLEGPASWRSDEPQTAILSEPPASAGGQFDEAKTRALIYTTQTEAVVQENVFPKSGSFSTRQVKPLVRAV